MDHRTDTEESELGTGQPQEGGTEGSASPMTTAAPASEPFAAQEQTAGYYRAGFWLRFVAFTIDLTVLGVFSLLLLIAAFLLSRTGADLSGLDSASLNSVSLLSLCEAAELIAMAAYFTILHGETGQTIGKSLLGLRVCTLDGQPLRYGHALLRFLAYGFSFFSLGLGFLWVALNPGKRGWHDLLTGTMVIVDNHSER